MKLKRKGVALGALVCVLALAVYLSGNYGADDALSITKSVETGKNLGEATLVNGEEKEGEDVAVMGKSNYFSKARITREQTRDEAMEVLKDIIDNNKSPEKSVAEATDKLKNIASYIEKEGKIENLIKAKNFKDCLVYISEEGVNVMANGGGLDDKKVAQIKDIVITELKIPVEKIKIVDVKE